MSSFTSDPEVRVTRNEVSNRTVFVLLKEFEYRVGDFDNPTEIIRVPVGFRTDFTSAPRITGINYVHRAHASLLHDWLLYTGRPPRECDHLFREALGVLGMGVVERNLYFAAVRLNSMIKGFFGMKIGAQPR